MSNDLTNKYFIKTSESGSFVDITTLYQGVRILSIEGFFDSGKTVNVYSEQWVDGQQEDFMVGTLDDNDHPLVIRENTDISVTFIVGRRYADIDIDVASRHDAFVRLLTSSDVWIKSTYAHKIAHCFCFEGYSPTVAKLFRGDRSFMMGTIKLHLLEEPEDNY